MYDSINAVFVYHGHGVLFSLPASFGALCTIVYALPGAPLAQPRIVYASHTYGMAVAIVIIFIFDQYKVVWLQKALAVSFTVGGMALFGIINPPAGALSLVFITYANSATYSDGGLLFLVVASYMACTVLVVVGMIVHNVLDDRGYPVCW